MGASFAQPTITLSSRSARLMRFGPLCEAAAAGGVYGIDLDLTNRLWLPSSRSIHIATQSTPVAVRGVWLPSPASGPISQWHSRRIVSLASAMGSDGRLRSFVIPHPPSRQAKHKPSFFAFLESLRGAIGPASRLAIAIRPTQLVAGRDHLSDMNALRRMAEEWDFDLALDLLGSIEFGWEAEATVMRLLPRLTLIRLGPIHARSYGRGREWMAGRVLATAVDAGFSGTLAIVPRTDLPPLLVPSALSEAAATMRADILARFGAVREDLAYEAHRPRPPRWGRIGPR